MARKNILTSAKKKKAVALVQARQLQQAKELYQQICKIDPVDAEAWFMLGTVHGLLGNLNDVVACCRRATSLEPGHSQAHYNLATAFRDLGRLEEAAVAYRQALHYKPDYVDAWDGLGFTLMSHGQLDDAIGAYREVLRYQPGSIKAHANLGASLQARGFLEEAIAAYREALRLDPANAGIQDSLGCALSEQGRCEEAMASHRHALAMAPNYSTAHSNLLLTMHYHPALKPDELFAEHVRWGRMHGKLFNRYAEYGHGKDVNRCLRVGYVSADFRAHSVAFFIEPVLANHNRAAIETVCYSGATNPDATTMRLRGMAAQWRDIGHLADEQVAETVRKDRIDILVDLAGHTPGNRLKVFARKPAPVQVTYLGYPDTTGLDTVDYRLTDVSADPVGTDKYCTEKLVRLPGSFLCYQPLSESPPVAPLPARGRGHVTFGSFNNLSKINPGVIDLWVKLLEAVPGARLFIKSPALTDTATRKRFHGLFEQRGVKNDRVELQGRTATQAEHLALYAYLDIALDPFPYNGATTTCEALWMGVPVIALAGDRHAGRVGVSILTQAGLTDLIAGSPDDYVRIAVELANNPARLSELRNSLRNRMAASPLCDAKAFTQAMEDAYRAMWREWCGA
jgi:predicted O-linked N-acetylglucosamine transferase (SPINDLY family)